jgi:hypothetical protein
LASVVTPHGSQTGGRPKSVSKRSDYRMVDEADPQWVRFWNAYPKRCSKKEARKAWLEVDPTSAQVDQMVEALAWQSQQPQWLKDDGQFIPYPASYLRGEKWTDEPPPSMRPKADDYGHYPPCRTHTECIGKYLNEERAKAGKPLLKLVNE